MRPGSTWTLCLTVSLTLSGCLGGGSQPKVQGEPIVAAFEFSPTIALVGEAVRFTDRSTGPIAAWSWDFGDGSTSILREPLHNFRGPGSYNVILTVSDARGRAATANHTLPVGGGAAPFTLDFTYVAAGRAVEFGLRITPPETVLHAVRWDFGDNQTSAEFAPVHTYAADGVYSVLLRAVSGGQVQSVTHPVPVGVGHTPDSLELAQDPWVVIAVVDSGINPYHEEFRDARFTAEPRTYITGYPPEARRLDLTLDKSLSFATARTADEEAWESVEGRKLYWIPGTRIVGAISYPQGSSEPNRILDDDGHGTQTASVAGGKTIGACPTCLVVAVEAFTPGSQGGDAFGALRWALNQPWIDIVSNSWTVCVVDCTLNPGAYPELPGSGVHEDTQRAVEAGKTVVFAAGNGVANAFDVPTPTYWSALTGPDWVVTVGAADSTTGATVVGTGRPVDVTSYGYNWKGASHTSTSSFLPFSGTSAAAPLVAGAFGAALQGVRDALGDTVEGLHARAVLATGTAPAGTPSGAAIADGKLTRAELERAVFRTARPATGSGPVFPLTLPESQASFAYAGWGLVNKQTAQEAVAVLLGSKALPDRGLTQTWADADSQARDALWGSWDPGP